MGHEYGNIVLGAEHYRHEDDDRCQRSGDDGDADFPDAFQRRLHRIPGIEVPMSKHAFGHDNGIVHQHADREHQPHHRQHVKTQTREVQRAQSDQQRERHRGSDNKSRRHLSQEGVQDEERQ